jgi:hypothetical protein
MLDRPWLSRDEKYNAYLPSTTSIEGSAACETAHGGM